MLHIKTMQPVKCHLWTKANLEQSDVRCRVIEQYDTDDDHLYRKLVACEECGQRYYYEFYEVIDWVNGNDPQYRTYIPIIPTPATINALNAASPFELCYVTPRLQIDWGAEDTTKTIKWVRD